MEAALLNPESHGLETLPARLSLFRKVAQILVKAHEQGCYHGSLSPASVFLGQFGEILLRDWPRPGASKPPSESQRAEKAIQDIAGELTVSSAYLAPERVRDPLAELTSGSDVYALGALLYTLLTLKSPVESQDRVEIRQQILRHDIIPPSKRRPDLEIPFPLEALTVKALAFDPANRQATAKEFLEQLEEALSQLQGFEATEALGASQNKKGRPLFVSAALLLLALSALTSFFLYSAAQSQREAKNATEAAQERLTQVSEREYLAKLRLTQAERAKEDAGKALKESREKENACIALVDKAQKERALAEQRYKDSQKALAEAKTVREQSLTQVLNAQRERANAVAALADARRKLAQNLVLQGRLLAQNQRWDEARRAYERGRDALMALEEAPLPANLGLWLADYEAPRPLLQLPQAKAQALKGLRALVDASPDGRVALSGGLDPHLYLWDLDTGLLLHKFHDAHPSPASLLALSPKRPLALSASRGFQIEVWDLKNKVKLRTLKGHKSPVRALAFDPGGVLAISGSEDGEVHLWNVESGNLIHSFRGHKGTLRGVAMAPDGQRIAAVGANGQLCIWDVTSTELLAELSSSQSKLSMVAFSPKQKQILVANERRVDIWNWQERSLLRSFTSRRSVFRKVCFSPNGRQLFTGSDRSLKIWNIEDGQLIRKIRAQSGPLSDFAVCEQGRLLLSADSQFLSLWDLRSSNEELRGLEGHFKGVSSVDVNRDGSLILTGSIDTRVRLWDRATGKLLQSFNDHKDAVTQVQFSPDGQRFASTDRSGTVLLWDLVSGGLLRRFPKQDNLISSLAFTPDNRQLLFGSQNQLTLWAINNSDTPSWTLRWAHKGFIRGLAFSPDGQVAYSVGEDGATRSWNVETGRAIKESRSSQSALSSLSISSDGQKLLTADSNRRLRVLDAKTLQELRTLQGHEESITAARFFPTRDYGLSSSMSGEIKVWKIDSGEELHSFRAHSRAVQSIALSRGPLIVTGASDGYAKILDLTRPTQYLNFENRLKKGRLSLLKNPKDAWALLDLGQWYAFRGHSGKAERLLKAAVASGASPRQLILARVAWLNGRYEEAKTAFKNALDNKEATEACITLYQRALRRESDRIGRKPN